MNNEKHVRVSGGIGLPTVLFIVFLILKLTNVIDWSWWLVTSPLWISAIFGVVIYLLGLLIGISIGIFRIKRRKNKWR